ncbi:hypothetical protein CASFOL_026481 [Castilleja foliolosa]|uniref:F-box domain-containing protein n=1 Tax=Castilleja foliolosa TaxID=1961234 RepID=A0ABD3CJ10_9LAMI
MLKLIEGTKEAESAYSAKLDIENIFMINGYDGPKLITVEQYLKAKLPEVVGVNLRSCKRKSLTDIESLPDELLVEVLVRLRDQDIYDSASLVCRKWYHMIHTRTFIYAHLQRSTYGLLFLSTFGRMGNSIFIALGESGRVEISEENRYNKLIRIPVQTSCNGLSLEYQKGSKYNLYVKNPATKQILALPQLGMKYLG